MTTLKVGPFAETQQTLTYKTGTVGQGQTTRNVVFTPPAWGGQPVTPPPTPVAGTGYVAGLNFDGATATDAGTISIEVNRSEGIGPAGFFFRVIPSGWTEDEEDLLFRVDYGDPGALFTEFQNGPEALGEDYPWLLAYEVDSELQYIMGNQTAPTGGTFMGIDRNSSNVRHAGHVYAPTAADFAAAGTNYIDYTVNAYVTSKRRLIADERWAQASITVRVYDPDDATVGYGDAGTAYISPTSDFPDGVSNTFTTWNNAVVGMRDQRKIRFLFNRGETHSTLSPALGGTSWFRDADYYNHMQAGNYGTGALPIIDSTHNLDTSNPQDFYIRTAQTEDCSICYWGLDRQGGYDVEAYWTGNANGDGFQTKCWNKGQGHKTILGCRANGFNKLIFSDTENQNLVIEDFYGTGWKDYGFYSNISISSISFRGVLIKQPAGCIDDDVRYGNGPGPDHGPWRCSAFGVEGRLGTCTMELMDLRTATSWDTGVQPAWRAGGAGNTLYHPDSKVNPDGSPKFTYDYDGERWARLAMSCITAEGNGGGGAGLFDGVAFPNQQIIDKIHFTLYNCTGDKVLAYSRSGTTYRNLVLQVLNQRVFDGNAFECVVALEPVDPSQLLDASNANYPLRFYNMTLVDERNASNVASGGGNWYTIKDLEPPTFYSELNWDNNIMYTPNRSTGAGTDKSAEPITITEAGPILWEGWYHDSAGTATSPVTPETDAAVMPGNGFRYYTPASGSTAYRTATTGDVALDDFFWTLRYGPSRPTPSQGAIEP